MSDKNKIPTFQEYRARFNRPNYLDDPRTPVEATMTWLKELENRYYELYGQEKIETLRPRKEGE